MLAVFRSFIFVSVFAFFVPVTWADHDVENHLALLKNDLSSMGELQSRFQSLRSHLEELRAMQARSRTLGEHQLYTRQVTTMESQVQAVEVQLNTLRDTVANDLVLLGVRQSSLTPVEADGVLQSWSGETEVSRIRTLIKLNSDAWTKVTIDEAEELLSWLSQRATVLFRELQGSSKKEITLSDPYRSDLDRSAYFVMDELVGVQEVAIELAKRRVLGEQNSLGRVTKTLKLGGAALANLVAVPLSIEVFAMPSSVSFAYLGLIGTNAFLAGVHKHRRGGEFAPEVVATLLFPQFQHFSEALRLKERRVLWRHFYRPLRESAWLKSRQVSRAQQEFREVIRSRRNGEVLSRLALIEPHLSLEERNLLEKALPEGRSFRCLAALEE